MNVVSLLKVLQTDITTVKGAWVLNLTFILDIHNLLCAFLDFVQAFSSCTIFYC